MDTTIREIRQLIQQAREEQELARERYEEYDEGQMITFEEMQHIPFDTIIDVSEGIHSRRVVVPRQLGGMLFHNKHEGMATMKAHRHDCWKFVLTTTPLIDARQGQTIMPGELYQIPPDTVHNFVSTSSGANYFVFFPTPSAPAAEPAPCDPSA